MIFEYLKWRGDINFSQNKFNKIDALVLSRMVYLPFENILKEEKTLKEVLEKFLTSKKNLKNVIMKEDIELAKELLKSSRFYKLKISNYVNNIDLETEKQFSAVTVKLNSNTKIVVFRGTDSSVIGWKEDFNMSFKTHIPAQLEAKEYLKKIMEEDDSDIIIAGHSKGGNLSIYSAIFIDDFYKDRIIKIYNFDGPGFNEEIVKDSGYEKILDKIETYIPQSAVVGILLERKEKPNIILSNEKYIMQHDIYSWNIERTDFIYADTISKESEIIGENVRLWLGKVTADERKEFIDSLFNTISGVNSDIKEIITNWQNSISLFIKTTKEPVLKDMLQKSIKLFFDSNSKK